jgi:hypothetical protein
MKDILIIFAVSSIIIGFGILLGYLAWLNNSNTPTALDVYRGKTTLEITYRDSVAIDSTVVYKVR